MNTTKYAIAVFVSGGGTNLQAIIDACAAGRLPRVHIACVIASKPDTFAADRARSAGIPCQVIQRKQYTDLASYDQALLAALEPYSVDLVVLAGFLSLLGPALVARYRNRIINIHPSLIPAFCGPGLYGLKPHQAALEYGVKITGATVHLVDEGYDEGPILLQKAVNIKSEDTAETLQRRVMVEAEQVILPEAIRLMSEGLVQLKGRRAIISGDPNAPSTVHGLDRKGMD